MIVATKSRGKSGTLPCISAKQHQQREDLQTAHDHAEGEHQLAHIGEKREVAHGTDHFKAGADVAHAGDDGSEGGTEGEIVETHHQCGAEDEEHIDDEYELYIQKYGTET